MASSSAGGAPVGFQRRHFKEAHGAVIEAVEKILVGPFKIKREIERPAHPDVLEFLAPQIEEIPLRARGRFIGQHGLLDAAILEGRKIIGRGPFARGVFLAKIDDAGFERLEARRALAEIIKAHLVEIIAAAVDRKVLGPIVGAPFVSHIFAGAVALDLVGAGSQRRLKAGLGEIMLGVIGFGKNRQGRDAQRQVADARALETVTHRMRRHHIASLDILYGEPDVLVAKG